MGRGLGGSSRSTAAGACARPDLPREGARRRRGRRAGRAGHRSTTWAASTRATRPGRALRGRGPGSPPRSRGRASGSRSRTRARTTSSSSSTAGRRRRWPRAAPARTYTLASNLPARQHTLMLTKRTEASFGVVQLLGLAPDGGALIPSREPLRAAHRVRRRLDHLRLRRPRRRPGCSFTADTEDETVAYGGLAAAALAAEPSVIAYSGKGMYRDYRSLTTDPMPVLFDRALPDDPDERVGLHAPPPDVVVINLSTNDFAQGDPGPPFVQALRGLPQQLRRHYPERLRDLRAAADARRPDRATSRPATSRASCSAGSRGGRHARVDARGRRPRAGPSSGSSRSSRATDAAATTTRA